MIDGQSFTVAMCSLLVLGCASKPEIQDSDDIEHTRTRGKRSTRPSVAGDDRRMGMQVSIGYLDENAVDAAMAPHLPAMIRCFERAGAARRYLSGQVALRIFAQSNGSVSDVQVIRNELGNYPVESCLIGVGRRMVFPPPEGGRGTDFEYSLAFRSTGELSVMNGDSSNVATRVASGCDLTSCGSLGPERVDAIAYVEPAGNIGSVGFVSRGPINPAAAACAEAQITKLRVSDYRSDVVLRAVFPMVVASRTSGKVDLHGFSKRSRRH
jgi:hypothetical protein